MQFVDAHHHLWQLGPLRYPWLMDEPPLVSDPLVNRDYLLEDFLADAAGTGLAKSVHVEANPAAEDRVRETAFIQELSERPGGRGLPNAIVASLDLASEDFERTLEGHLQYPKLRGIRQVLNPWAAPPGLMSDPGWRANLAALAARGLRFDLHLEPMQMQEAVRMIAAMPEVPIALNHTGFPSPQAAGGREVWRAGLRALAACDSVSVKISGFGAFGLGEREAMRPYVLEAIDLFGPERAMFASNFPVCKPGVGYRELWAAYDAITAGFTEAERARLFRGTAEAFYAL